MTDLTMPPALREQVIEILAAALVADIEQHPELYAGDPAPDSALTAGTDETPRGLARSRPGAVSLARRRRVKASAEAALPAPGSHA